MFRLTRDGSDTDSTYTDFTLTPGGETRSPGTASTFSIPWAEDAIRQNKDDWERIERMMHCEESLPLDEGLRRELSEWMEAFPHLRVIGQPCQFQPNPTVKASDPDYEEVFAIHPNTEEEGQNIPIRTLDFEGLSIGSGQGFVEKVKTIEIDSSGRVTRNSVEYRKQSSRVLPDVGFVLRRSGTALSVSQLKPSRSAATVRPSMSLPPITDASALDGVVGRSISATVHSRKHTKRKNQLPSLRGHEEI